jgi:AcrR family transcriptional regulator
MTRTVDETRPAELLDAIVAYLVQHGVAELSLRPLAKAVGSSPRVLLYYFGSKEDLVATAVTRLRERQRVGFAAMREARYQQPSDACRAIWKQMSAPASEALFRLSLETFSLALRHRDRFADYLHSSVEDWLDFLSEPLTRQGVPLAETRAYATVIICGFRGFMLDYCASHDRARVDRAVDLWIGSLDQLAPKPPAPPKATSKKKRK